MLALDNILPITQVKRDLMRLLTGIKSSGDHIVITKEGKAAGVLISVDEYESIMETIAVLNDTEVLRDLKRAREDFRKGRVYTHDEVFGK